MLSKPSKRAAPLPSLLSPPGVLLRMDAPAPRRQGRGGAAAGAARGSLSLAALRASGDVAALAVSQLFEALTMAEVVEAVAGSTEAVPYHPANELRCSIL